MSDLTAPELALEFPAKPEYLRVARHAVAALARLHAVPEDCVEDVKLAVSEACARAVAGAVPEEAPPVELRAQVEATAVVVEVLDRGPGPEREVSGPPEDIDTGELPFEAVLTLPLIRGLVDDLAIGPREGGGTRLRMVFALPEP
ncbi:MAG TPA: ATP-binding protein [Actinomycetota bacterium]|nr:ATP-binding protein [Actinomycetota bacterium]